MQYKLSIAGEEKIIDVETDGSAAVMNIDGREKNVRFKRLPNGALHLSVAGKIATAHTAVTDQGGQVFIDGRIYNIADADKAPARKRLSGVLEGPGEVTPPMPAVVVRVSAVVGETVEKGQGLVVVSAMKMETTLSAPYSGVITAVNTEVDAKVTPGEILVEIEADNQEEDQNE